MVGEVRSLSREFTQLNSQMGRSSGGGSFAQRQVADLRQVLQLQQQIIANQGRMIAGPGGGGSLRGGGGGGGGGGFLGRSGFSPNASIQDRLQYRGVNFLERSLTEGVLQSDMARTRLSMLNLSPGTIAQAEHTAAAFAQQFRELTKSDILETFGEIVTQFRTDDEAFRMLPHLLRIQELDVMQGLSRTGGRDSMLRLLRAIGLSGRLSDREGNFNEQDSAAFLDAYARARLVGGADVNADQAFQLMKYLKSTGQTISNDALLQMMIAMPDLRASTFGNQTNMLIRQLTGGATKEAMAWQARMGLISGGIDPNSPAGPRKFRYESTVDNELLRSDPTAWVQKHFLGPQGVLRRLGLDPVTASPAQIAAAIRPGFSNQSAENIVNSMINTMQEWQNQVQRGQRLDLSRMHTDRVKQDSIWNGLQQARAQITNAFTSIAENFKSIILPPLFRFAEGLQAVARWTDPRTGNPYLSLGVLGAGGAGAFMLLRALVRSMGPMGRTLLGAGLGFGFGGITEALLGGMMMRGTGGGAAAAAGAAGAAAGAAWRSRFLAGLFGIGRLIRSMTIWGAVSSGIYAVVENWEAVKTALLKIWADLKAALPDFLGGGGQGLDAFRNGQSGEVLKDSLIGMGRSMRWINDTALGQWLIANGYLLGPDRAREIFAAQGANRLLGAGIPQGFLPPGMQSQELPPGWRAAGPITINVGGVTVNVAQTNADPNQIGEAAGNAVGARLRQYLADSPQGPY